ncbi:YqgE/AlgH family protein [Swingsia samuiensis]|uniref:UPF0301 protein E3D00_06330 n=1 Tax=Swingsia samuiensis TaxID=1293412 RepID=A0A4Y6UKA4_9PROT|nr:YqgE/AlgH family protein [Swingsia samuiensis]QDH17220.1 YqgE/AlgH family protein [Swingsia samuiensis]
MKKALINQNDNLTGRLLIAAPLLGGTEFEQSLIYICAHSPHEGAMGLVVNKSLSHPKINEIFSQLDITPNPPQRDIPLYVGGPVEPSRGFVLHTSDWEGENGLKINNQVILTAGLDVLKEVAVGKGPQHAIMALGHASWGPGQLEDEIFKGNSWLVAPFDQDIMFSRLYEEKWLKALRSIDVDPLYLSSVSGEA